MENDEENPMDVHGESEGLILSLQKTGWKLTSFNTRKVQNLGHILVHWYIIINTIGKTCMEAAPLVSILKTPGRHFGQM